MKFVSHHQAIQCPSALLKLLGDFWTLKIIEALTAGEFRFCQLENKIGANPATLTNRLKRLEEAGLIERKEETQDKQSVAYSLTRTGQGLQPLLIELTKFAKKYKKEEA